MVNNQKRSTKKEEELRLLLKTVKELSIEKSRLQNHIDSIHNSRFWKVAQYYYKLKKAAYIPVQIDIGQEIETFILKSKGAKIIIMFTAVGYTDREGHRSVALTKHFSKENICIFVYFDTFNFKDLDWGTPAKNIFVIPNEEFIERFNMVQHLARKMHKKLIFIAQNPCRDIMYYLAERSINKFSLVYDIIDDWEDCHKLGLIDWYSREVEEYLLRKSDSLLAVSPPLIKKFKQKRIHLIPNGFDAAAGMKKGRSLMNEKDNNISLGYVGWLDPKIFNWQLIEEVAKKRLDWKIHLIGYGFPKNKRLEKNIIYHGVVRPQQLGSYIPLWNVCLVPFKESGLATRADPVKIYIYLYMGKPVVVSSVYHLKAYPGCYVVKGNSDKFIEAVEMAIKSGIKMKEVDTFLAQSTWKVRANKILSIIDQI